MTTNYTNDEPKFAVLVFGFIAVVHFLYASITIVPTIYRDEIGYLMNAAAIVGYQSDAATDYSVGYSLLLTPAFLLFDSAVSVYFFVKAINTFLFVGTVVALYHLTTRLMYSTSRSEILMAIAVASVYPAFLIFNALALSENAFIFLFVLSAVFAMRLTRPSVINWLIFGLCVGLLFITHLKSIPVVVASLIVGGYLALKDKRLLHFAAFFVVLASSIFIALTLSDVVQEALTVGNVSPEPHYAEPSAIFNRLISWQGFLGVLGNLAGQSLYLIAASVGTVVFGVIVAIEKSRSGELLDRHVWVFMLLAFGGTIAISALTLDSAADGARLDHVFYGRYNEGVFFPFLVVGLLSATRVPKPWVMLVIFVGVLALITHFFLLWYPKPSTGLLNMSSLYYLRYVETRLGLWHPWVIFAVFSAITFLWILISRLSTIRFFPIAFAFFVFTAGAYGIDLLYIHSHARQMQTKEITDYVNTSIKRGECINYDVDSQSWRKMWLYPYLLYQYPLQRVTVDGQTGFCSKWLISDNDRILSIFPEAEPIVSEQYGDETLWSLP